LPQDKTAEDTDYMAIEVQLRNQRKAVKFSQLWKKKGEISKQEWTKNGMIS